MDQSFKLSDGYRNWAAFVDEFRRIEESLQESKRVERLLVVRCNTLKSEIVDSGKKLHTVMSVRAEDEKTIALLRKECDKSAATAAEAKLKQKQAMALVSGLQADIEALQAQVGVLQSALWLERERANAAVKASRSAISLAKNTDLGAATKSALIALDPTLPASRAAAEAAVAAAGVLAKSSTGEGVSGGPPGQRRHVPPVQRLGGAGVGAARRGRGASSRRPATASAASTQLVSRQVSGKFRAAGDLCRNNGGMEGSGGLGGWKSNDDHEALEGGAYGLGSLGSGAASTTDTLGLGGWATHGIDGYFHGGGRRNDDDQRERRLQEFVRDLDGRMGSDFRGDDGLGGVAGGPKSEEGIWSRGGAGADVTPFELWKREKGIFSPGVAQVFGGRTCRA